MARHNRDGYGADQCGADYRVNYQPDWLRLVKVTRELESGRQSTRTVFRNPAQTRESRPGEKIRAHVVSCEEGESPAVDFEVAIRDPGLRVTRIQVACLVEGPGGETDEVEFTFEGALPPAP